MLGEDGVSQGKGAAAGFHRKDQFESDVMLKGSEKNAMQSGSLLISNVASLSFKFRWHWLRFSWLCCLNSMRRGHFVETIYVESNKCCNIKKGWPWGYFGSRQAVTLHQSFMSDSAACMVAEHWGLFDFLALWLQATSCIAFCSALCWIKTGCRRITVAKVITFTVRSKDQLS